MYAFLPSTKTCDDTNESQDTECGHKRLRMPPECAAMGRNCNPTEVTIRTFEKCPQCQVTTGQADAGGIELGASNIVHLASGVQVIDLESTERTEIQVHFDIDESKTAEPDERLNSHPKAPSAGIYHDKASAAISYQMSMQAGASRVNTQNATAFSSPGPGPPQIRLSLAPPLLASPSCQLSPSQIHYGSRPDQDTQSHTLGDEVFVENGMSAHASMGRRRRSDSDYRSDNS